MGLLSKLLGGAVERKLEQTVKSAVGGAVTNAVNSAIKQARPVGAAAPVSQPRQQTVPKAQEPSGFSWGPVMPAEENQYNYPGSYGDYFAHVFREDFPEYRADREEMNGGRSTVFTLWSPAGNRALVVELMPESSEAKKLRKDCAAQGVPYLRFYYNHEGWWNTRAYVSQRVRTALKG